MKFSFKSNGRDTVHINIWRQTIGQGEPGAKSLALRKYAPLAEAANPDSRQIVNSLPTCSLTPEFFSGIIKRSGASHDNLESRRALGNIAFTKEEIEGIIIPLTRFGDLCTAWRSDEVTANGVGLWHTGFLKSGAIHALLPAAQAAIIEILTSDFSQDAIAFKKRLGLPMETVPGVLVMPLAADCSNPNGAFTTRLHANGIVNFWENETMRLDVGAGIGGANNKYDSFRLTSLSYRGYQKEVAQRLDGLLTADANYLSDGKLVPYSQLDLTYSWLDRSFKDNPTPPDAILNLMGYFSRLASITKERLYWELAFFDNAWGLLQAAETNAKNISKPDIPDSQKVLQVKGFENVSGIQLIEADKVIYIKDADALGLLSELNNEATNYLLILSAELGSIEEMYLHFWQYSNAAAIVFDGFYPYSTTIGSHMNGATREAGIALFSGNMGGSFRDSLKNGGISDKKLVIYAHEALGEGFIATKD